MKKTVVHVDKGLLTEIVYDEQEALKIYRKIKASHFKLLQAFANAVAFAYGNKADKKGGR
jgi:hypothetical protein